LKRGLGIGAVIGCLWSALGYALLVMPVLRENMRLLLGRQAIYVLILFPSTWVAGLFGNYDPRGGWRPVWPLLACLAAGVATGMAVAWILVILRRRRRER